MGMAEVRVHKEVTSSPCLDPGSINIWCKWLGYSAMGANIPVFKCSWILQNRSQ